MYGHGNLSSATALTVTVVVACVASLTAARPAGAANPAPQVLSVVNAGAVNPRQLRRIERAVVRQVDHARRWWPQMPSIRFGKGGWTVTLDASGTQVSAVCGAGAAGCHSATSNPDGTITDPFAMVAVNATGDPWSVTFDHEILEMLTNPTTLLFAAGSVEICDLAEGWTYLTQHVWLSDYVLPAAYSALPKGRVDLERDVRAKDVREDFAFDGIPLGSVDT